MEEHLWPVVCELLLAAPTAGTTALLQLAASKGTSLLVSTQLTEDSLSMQCAAVCGVAAGRVLCLSPGTAQFAALLLLNLCPHCPPPAGRAPTLWWGTPWRCWQHRCR